MFATATVVEIDDQIRGDCFKIIVPAPRTVLIPRLYEAFADYEKRTAAGEPQPFDVALQVTPDRRVTIIISTSALGKVLAEIDGLDPAEREELWESLVVEARDERRLVAIIAENLRRIMDRDGITLDSLASHAGMAPARLAEILDKRASAALLDEVSDLAESLGTTTDELILRPKDRGAPMELNPLQNQHEWHRRPFGSGRRTTDKNARYAPCPLCGCPAYGTLGKGRMHRAMPQAESSTFAFVVRYRSIVGWVENGILPIGGSAQEGRAPTTEELNVLRLSARLYAHRIGFREMGIRYSIRWLQRLRKRFPAIWTEELKYQRDLAAKAKPAATEAKKAKERIRTARRRVERKALRDALTTLDDRARWRRDLANISDADLAATPSAPAAATLSSFFSSYFRPARLAEAAPKTVAKYIGAIRAWKLITSDPPLLEITNETMLRFKEVFAARPGKEPGKQMSPNTLRGALRHIQAILDRAGPPGPRRRDAAGILAVVPYVRQPRLEMKLPRTVTPEVLKLVYDATAGMDWPRIPGIKPPAWWKSLLEIVYYTGLRRRTLFEMRMDEIDWGKNCLRLPAARFKNGRPFIVHLNPPAMEALRRIRTARELIFPTGECTENFYKHLHRLQDSAGIPPKEHFGLHVIRKTAATVLAEFSPQTAQLALGHGSLMTTLNSYIDPTRIIGASLDAMPQPFGLSTL